MLNGAKWAEALDEAQEQWSISGLALEEILRTLRGLRLTCWDLDYYMLQCLTVATVIKDVWEEFSMATETSKVTLIRIIQTIFGLLLLPALVLFLSGNWLWVEGWVFGLWFIVMCSIVIVYLYRNDPALLAERYKQPGAANQICW